MLIRFSVENFLSICGKETLDMTTVSTCKERLEDNTFTVGKYQLLKNVIIYGANASGKSNLFIAIKHMADFIVNSAKESQVAEDLHVMPFLLNKKTRKAPSCFEIDFIVNGIQYRYGFEATKKRFEKEWLFALKNGRETALFLRSFDGDHDNIQVENTFLAADKIIKMTRENTLFLSACAAWSIPEAKDIVEYFSQKFHILYGNRLETIGNYTNSKIQDVAFCRKIVTFLSHADMGIQDIKVIERDMSTTMVGLRAKRGDPGSSKLLEIKSVHSVYDDLGNASGKEYFNFYGLESHGTKKAFTLAGPIIAAIERGDVLIIDELDSSLHPIFVRQIIAMFNSAKLNPKNAQLIINTHDTNLLGYRVCREGSKKEYILRRDQIYFAEKDQAEASHYYSLIEFKEEKENGALAKVRNDASFESDYLNGRYGAIPFIGNLLEDGSHGHK